MMNRQKERIKVLSLGISQSNFLLPLYRALKENFSMYVAVADMKHLHKNANKHSFPVFDEHLRLANASVKDFTVKDRVRALLRVLFSSFLWKETAWKLLLKEYRLDWKELFRKAMILSLLDKKMHHAFRSFDVFHFHFCAPEYFYLLDLIPKDKKVICSIWGTDLFGYSGIYSYRNQLKGFQRADLITIHSPEMREVLLAKFGRMLKPKVRYVLFGNEEKFFNLMDRLNTASEREIFRIKFGIKENKTVIAISYNASKANNHLKILEALSQLDSKLKVKLHLVLPLTYGIKEPSYIEELRERAESTGIKYTLVTEFLSEKDLALLRLCSDLMIHMPESDAMSASVVETLYAGNIVLAGCWLPYGNFRRKGIPYVEVTDYSELPLILKQIMMDFCHYKAKAQEGIKYVRKHYVLTHTIENWYRVYSEMGACLKSDNNEKLSVSSVNK